MSSLGRKYNRSHFFHSGAPLSRRPRAAQEFVAKETAYADRGKKLGHALGQPPSCASGAQKQAAPPFSSGEAKKPSDKAGAQSS